MKIALIGYGKMGKAIEAIVVQNGDEVVLKISSSNKNELTRENLQKADVAIEFTSPESAVDNLKRCFEANIPVVCGSTGWLGQWEEVKASCMQHNGTLLYASNFSIGVNLFFELNTYLAKLMNAYADYDVSIEEIHHTQKKDAPSGTAITLAEQILANISRKESWVSVVGGEPNNGSQSSVVGHRSSVVNITSKRIDPAPGTHKVKYTSSIDDIEIIHAAHNRQGFAAGALKAAEFIRDKKGIFTMKDVLGL